MILEAVISNLTNNLDLICQQDGKSISSHEKLKHEALKCLINMIENAPESEYRDLIHSKDHEILLGYLLSILCQITKNDKSRANRLQALEIMNKLVTRLECFHETQSSSEDSCSITTLILALPGVSSALFKLIISDTKLPKAIVVKSIQTLAKLIAVTYSDCDHCMTSHLMNDVNPKLTGQSLIEACDNLAPRIGYLVDYVTTNCDAVHTEIKIEMLDFCLTIVNRTKIELLTRTLKPIVRYLAFISSTLDQFEGMSKDAQLKLMILTDGIRVKMEDPTDRSDRLDSMALDCIFKLLNDLEENSVADLVNERQAHLAMLCGLLTLLTQDVLMTFLETSDRRTQLLTILIQLVEFSPQQPFLFLTDSRVEPGSLERRGAKIYTIEKRFIHLTDKEIIYVNSCCNILGHHSEWSFLCDFVRSDLMRFASANNLYVTLQVLKGSLNRDGRQANVARFTSQLVESYTENIQTQCFKINQEAAGESYSEQILKTVISIETIAVLVQLHLKFVANEDRRVVILKDLLCPVLYWCSSSSRAVSEAALNALTHIGQLYGHDSTKSFIEEYTDYIVNGVSMMLDDYLMNPEVVDVLAITFKLSSMVTFYYFKDIYGRIFRILAKYHHTEKAKSIVLLFFRTLTILNGWVDAKRDANDEQERGPLESEASVKSVINSLDIDRRIEKLRNDLANAAKLDQEMEDFSRATTAEDELDVRREIEASDFEAEPQELEQEAEVSPVLESDKEAKSEEVILTEKILKHCIGLMSSDNMDTKTLAIKTTACGLRLLRNDEDTLLPLVHQIWPPLMSRLTDDYGHNLEANLCAFECLILMATYSKDFIRRRTLDAVVPRLCLFLESQAARSRNKKDYEPYCMTIAYKCQLKILTHMGQLAYHTDIAYDNLWRIVEVVLRYVDSAQAPALREAARNGLKYLIALDADCVWHYAKQNKQQLDALPFALVFETF